MVILSGLTYNNIRFAQRNLSYFAFYVTAGARAVIHSRPIKKRQFYRWKRRKKPFANAIRGGTTRCTYRVCASVFLFIYFYAMPHACVNAWGIKLSPIAVLNEDYYAIVHLSPASIFYFHLLYLFIFFSSQVLFICKDGMDLFRSFPAWRMAE